MQGNTEDYKKAVLIMSCIPRKEFFTISKIILQKHGEAAAAYFQGYLKERNHLLLAAVRIFAKITLVDLIMA